jgi:hypothetical protein
MMPEILLRVNAWPPDFEVHLCDRLTSVAEAASGLGRFHFAGFRFLCRRLAERLDVAGRLCQLG